MKKKAEEMSMSLKVKLGSIVMHAEELASPHGHEFDKHAITGLLLDPEVKAFLASIPEVMLPRKRNL